MYYNKNFGKKYLIDVKIINTVTPRNQGQNSSFFIFGIHHYITFISNMYKKFNKLICKIELTKMI